MDTHTLLNNFGTIADAPDGVDRLRELILDLAVRGRFATHETGDQAESFETVEPLFDLPTNWVWTSIDKVGVVNPRNDMADDDDAGFVPMALISEYFSVPHQHEVRKWSEIKKGYTHLVNGDVAIAKITPCFENGKACVIRDLPNGGGSGTTELLVIRTPHVDPEYLLIYFKSRLFVLNGIPRMTGTAGQKRLPSEFFKTFPMPLPPRAEQARIVERVRQLMAFCDQLDNENKKREALRAAARESAIDAVSNASTPEQLAAAWARIRDNWTTYADTPESIATLRSLILRLAMQQKLLPSLSGDGQDKPRVVDLKEVLTLEYGKPLERQLRTTDGPVPAYGANGIKTFTEKPLVKTRGIVVGRKGSAGQVNITEGPFWPLDVTFFAQFDETIHDVRYLYYLLQSLELSRFARGVKPGINRNDVHQLKVLKVSLDVQVETVGRVDELMLLCDELEVALSERNTLREKFASSVTHEVVDAA